MATQHVHTEVAGLYPEALPAVGNLRSARDLLSQISHSFECGAVRFLLWWLSSTAGYVPATRLKLAPERLGSPLAGPIQRALPVFIRALKKASQLPPASLSASTLGVIWNNSRLLLLSPGRYRLVRRSRCWSSKPVSSATRRVILQAIFFVKLFCVLFFSRPHFFSNAEFSEEISREQVIYASRNNLRARACATQGGMEP